MNIEISPKEYERTLNWDDAMMYCQLLTIDGKNDWRIPSKEELQDMYNSENDLFRPTKEELNYIYNSDDSVLPSYWSSTEYGYVWFVCMSTGSTGFGTKDGILYVRPVRSLTTV